MNKMIRKINAVAISLMASLAPGCVASEVDDDTAADGPALAVAEEGKEDSTDLRVRAGQMTVWMNRKVDVVFTGNQVTAVIRGRASRNLTNAFSFIPDDGYGSASLLSSRTFSITLRDASEINSLMSGLPIFVDLDVATGSHDDYALKLEIRPTLTAFRGSSALQITSALQPVHVGREAADPLRYQTKVRTAAAPVAVSGLGVSDVYPSLGGSTVDFTYGQLQSVWRTNAPIRFTDGAQASKSASLELRVSGVAMTTGDAYDTWPTPECNNDVYNCALENRGVDTATCGSYREVQTCLR
jgi:hypothetical protein